MFLNNFILLSLLCKLISSKMQEFVLDVNDILSENLMPMSLMLVQGNGESDTKNSTHRTLDDEFQCVTKERITGKDGTFSNAFSSMGFHRKMINNFLCSKFIAEQILDDVQPSGTRAMNRRLGLAKTSPEMEFTANNSLSFGGGRKKSEMLHDEGSFEYKSWLAK